MGQLPYLTRHTRGKYKQQTNTNPHQTTTATQASSTNPAAERIRENQRRSRARRKEFVEGMQRRLDEYEKQGVEATLQMQQAARTVAIENARLRLLLARRGVNNTEVDKFLGMFDGRDDEILQAGNGLQGFPPSTTPAYTHTASTTSTYQHHDPHHSEAAGIDRLAVLADASIGDSCSSSTSATTPSESTVAAQSPPSAGPSTMPGTPVSGPHSHYHGHPHQHHHHHHHATPQPPAGSGSPLVMSCNTAAQIIAEMQGGAPVNRHAVKTSLGCADAECECFVKNTLLFQIMEKNTA